MRTYTAYSIGCGVVWTVLLIAGALAGNGSASHTVLDVFLGWVLGWPPPKKWRQSAITAP